MFKMLISLLCVTALLLIPALEARGGRGGGGGGGRGGARMGGGRSMQRSPSMSRAQTRPRDFQRGNFQNRNFSRADADRFFNDRPLDVNRLNVSNNRFTNADFGNRVRRDVRDYRPGVRNAFNNSFWDRHHLYPSYWGVGYNGWGWATAAGINSWLGWETTPLYYDYSSAEPTYYAPSDYQAMQSIVIPSSPQATSQGGGEWMSLGVFALTREGSSTPNVYLQLALSKQGIISGTYYNALTDQTHEVQGSLDQATQRVALQLTNSSQSPILETGLYNLTQSEAPAQIHFADGSAQSITLIRLASE